MYDVLIYAHCKSITTRPLSLLSFISWNTYLNVSSHRHQVNRMIFHTAVSFSILSVRVTVFTTPAFNR